MARDYKNTRYVRDVEGPLETIAAFAVLCAIGLVLLTAPTWGAWIDSIGVCK
jgi:hypothetical protein